MSDTKKKPDENPARSELVSASSEGRAGLESFSAEGQDAELRIVCLHRGLDEDLMFRESMVRHLESVRPRPPMIIVAGAGEAVERTLESDGHVVSRTAEEIELSDERARAAFERGVREDGRRLVAMLSESGVASVFFFGGDRGLLRRPESRSLAVAGTEPIVALALSGVVPIVGAACIDGSGLLSDVHPIRVAQSLFNALHEKVYKSMVRMVLTVPRIPGEVSIGPGISSVPAGDVLRAKGLKLSEPVVSMLTSGGIPFSISTPAGIGDVSQIRVGV